MGDVDWDALGAGLGPAVLVVWLKSRAPSLGPATAKTRAPVAQADRAVVS